MFYKIVVPGPEPGTYLSCHGGSHRWEPDVTRELQGQDILSLLVTP